MSPRPRPFTSDAFDVRLQIEFEGGPLDSVSLSIEFERNGPRSLDGKIFTGAERTFGWNIEEFGEHDGMYVLARRQDDGPLKFRWEGGEPA